MKNMEQQLNELRQENEKLHQRLRETEETLSAIRNGEVDAVVVHSPGGDQIFSLKGVDHSYRILIEEMHEGAMMLSRDGLILYANRFMESILGVALEEIIGSLLHRFIVPADLPFFLAILNETNQGGRSVELQLKTCDDYLIPAHLSISRLSLEHEAIFCLAIIDLTALNRNELILIEERLCRSIVEQSAEAIIVCDSQGTIIRASSITSDLIGLNCLTMPFDEVFQLRLMPDSVAILDSRDFQTFTIQDVIEGSIYRSREAIIESAPEARNVLLSATSMRDKENTVIGCTVNLVDITKRKQGDEERLRLITAIEQCVDSIVIADKDGLIQYINPGFEQVTGYAREKVIGKNPNILKSGKQDKLFYEKMWKTLAAGKPWRGHLTNKKLDGTLYEEEASITPVLNESGEIVNYVAVKRDVTEQRKVEAQLKQAQKMESVGRLAGGVAHDFNNMLGVILGHTEMALDDVDPASPLYASLQAIQHAAERSAALTMQLLAFARKQTVAPKVIDINETVAGMLNMLRRLIGEDIDLLWGPGEDLPSVKIDPAQIDQLLANLCVNARDAIEGIGKITIETDRKTFDAAYCADHPGFLPGEYVLIEVSDDGCGMDQAVLNQIFEPFFTTKEQGKGTGLGLASVFGMVKQNNGFIDVYSEWGQGTTFKVYLPKHTVKSADVKEKAPNVPAERGHETILLVEDEPTILRMATRMLTRLGYTVVAAATPGEAIRLALECQGKIDLLMTDVVMPEMNGRDLAGNLLSHYPDLKRLFMSGYTADIIAHHGVLDEGVHFIQKPFSMKDLGRKLRKTLDG